MAFNAIFRPLAATVLRRLSTHAAPQPHSAPSFAPTAAFAAIANVVAGYLVYQSMLPPPDTEKSAKVQPPASPSSPASAAAAPSHVAPDNNNNNSKSPASASPSSITGNQAAPSQAPLSDTTVQESLPKTTGPDDAASLESPANPEPRVYNAPYLIVGAGTASHFAVKGIQERDPTAKILIIGNGKLRPYARPPLSKEVWYSGSADASVEDIAFESWSGEKRNVFYNDAAFYISADKLAACEQGGVALMSDAMVVELDPVLKRAVLNNGDLVHYDKCLLATGARPRNLPVFASAAPEVQANVILYRTASDFLKLRDATSNAKRVVVIGGGFLGSELAVALANHGKGVGFVVDQVFKEDGNMAKVLPQYLSDWSTEQIHAQGVVIHASSTVVKAEPASGSQVLLTLADGKTITADKVLVAVGVDPNVALAAGARLEVDPKRGGIVVNSELQARTDVWVAGDVCNFYDISLGRRREEHHDQAAVSGRLAGNNMAGARRPYFHQSMFWSELGPKIGYEAIGIIDSSLPTVSVWAKATDKDSPVGALAGPDTAPLPTEDGARSAEYGKGVVFYMRGNQVVGILLWNVFNCIPIARKIIRSEKEYANVKDLARFFKLYD